MPFGICTSGDAFNQIMTELLSNIKGIEITVDDILVHGSSLEEHDARVGKMLQRARQVGQKINPLKCIRRVDHVQYCSYIISKDGLKPSSDHIKPVFDMLTQDEVRRFLARWIPSQISTACIYSFKNLYDSFFIRK